MSEPWVGYADNFACAFCIRTYSTLAVQFPSFWFRHRICVQRAIMFMSSTNNSHGNGLSNGSVVAPSHFANSACWTTGEPVGKVEGCQNEGWNKDVRCHQHQADRVRFDQEAHREWSWNERVKLSFLSDVFMFASVHWNIFIEDVLESPMSNTRKAT